MTTDELHEQYTRRYEAELEAGSTIKIDYMLPSISIKRKDGEEWWFQEHEAYNLLDEVPEWIDPEVFILASSTEW